MAKTMLHDYLNSTKPVHKIIVLCQTWTKILTKVEASRFINSKYDISNSKNIIFKWLSIDLSQSVILN